MIDFDRAKLLFSQWLAANSVKWGIELAAIEDQTRELEFGWMFFYTSKRFLQTGDFSDAVAGNAPVIVDHTLGSLHVTGTAYPVAAYIEEFQKLRTMTGLATASFIGPPAQDHIIMTRLPREYASLLRLINGYVVYGGGLHVRGVCNSPAWHSLERAWNGDDSLQALYASVKPNDIPFGQDCLGDQFLIRSGSVWRLNGETGETENLELDWRAFLSAASADPTGFLSLQPLEQFQREGRELQPGELLSVYPPFCTKESAAGASLNAVPAQDRIRFLAGFAARIDGQ